MQTEILALLANGVLVELIKSNGLEGDGVGTPNKCYSGSVTDHFHIGSKNCQKSKSDKENKLTE